MRPQHEAARRDGPWPIPSQARPPAATLAADRHARQEEAATPKLYLGEASGLLGTTLSFIWVRLGSCMLLFAGLAVYFAVVGGLAWLLGRLWEPLGWVVFLVALGYVEYVIFLIVLALPALAIGAVLPGAGPVLAVLVFVGAWMLKLALADAFALASTLIAYHRETVNLTPNAEWQAKLEGASEKFRELGRKAAEGLRVPGGTAVAARPEPAG